MRQSLDIDEIASVASSYGWVEVQYNEVSRVIGFRRGDQRVNVYYNTGTVGTCVTHPRLSKTQLFRREQTIDQLEAIFDNPRVHTGVGYYRKSVLPKKRKEPRGTPGLACRLLSDELTSSLTASYAVQALPSVALGHGWVVFSKDGSEYAQFTHAPLALCNLISGRRQQRQPAPRLVSLGPDDNFFVQFSDGEWRLSAGAPPALREALLRNGERPVRCIAFDPHGVGYFVLWDDGLSVWDDLPLGLHNLLNSRQRSLPGVEHVAMGPRGEFFVRFVGGAWRLGDCCDPEQWDFVQGLKSRGCEVLRCTFGQEGSWAVEYA